MPGDIVGIERRTGKGTDRIWIGGPAAQPQRRVVEIRPEYRLRRLQRLRADRGLSPANHLCVEPGGLHGIGPRRPFPPYQQITAAFANGAVRRNLEAAIKRSPDDVGIDADSIWLRQQASRFSAVLRLLDEFGGARCGPDQG